MNRRQFMGGVLLYAAGGSDRNTVGAGELGMNTGTPERIRLIPDRWHIFHVGRLSGERSFWTVSQLDPNRGATKDFVCTFIFDQDGQLIENSIELIGLRGSYARGSVGQAIDRHLAALGDYVLADIWVRLFSIESHGVTFGLIPRQLDDGEWRVEAMPGNTLSFYATWDVGEYDT